MASATQSSEPTNLQNWAPGALIAAAFGLLYLAVRPPLFDSDGYVYRLVMLGPDRLEYMDHAHLLWEPLQILMVAIARPLGNSTIFPFQIFGILVNCATLFLFWILLRRVSGNSLFASVAVITVACSPRFWYLGSQNEPYPLLFLFAVLYLAWSYYSSRNSKDRINHDAHIAGALTGIAFVALTDPQRFAALLRYLTG